MKKPVSDILQNAEANLRTGQEMAEASAFVVQKRLEKLAGAAVDPIRADHAEIGRMGSEKVEAFTASAGAASHAAFEMGEACTDIARRTTEQLQANLDALSRETDEAKRLALQTEQVAQFWGQAMVDGMALWSQGLSAQAKIMAPLHARVTENAKRLKD